MNENHTHLVFLKNIVCILPASKSSVVLVISADPKAPSLDLLNQNLRRWGSKSPVSKFSMQPF